MKPMLTAPIHPTARDAAACSDLLTACEALFAETGSETSAVDQRGHVTWHLIGGRLVPVIVGIAR